MTDYTSLYLLSDEERAYFVKLYEEITQGLLEEGIDYRPIRFDYPGILTVEQITRINRSLSAGPIRALKAVQEAAGRKAFMFYAIDLGKTHVLSIDEYAALFPNSPADYVKKNTYFSAPDKPAFVGFMDWNYMCSDIISNIVGSPRLNPITPGTPEYFLLVNHPNTEDADPETIAKLRDLLGLRAYRFIGLSLWEQISFCKGYLEETKALIDAENAQKAARSRAAKEKARESGGLTDISGAALAVPDKKTDKLAPVYRDMLSRNRFFRLQDEDAQKIDGSGRLIPLAFSGKKREDALIEDPRSGFLSVVLSCVLSRFETSPDTQENSVKINLPSFFDETGIDPRPHSSQRAADLAPINQLRYEKMIYLLSPYDNVVGSTPNGSFYRLASVGGYDSTTENFIIYCPYLFECIRQTDITRFTRLAHADIANEPNTAAVEIAYYLLRGLVLRGSTTPDKATYTSGADQGTKKKPLFSYEVTFKSVIRDCQQISFDLEQIESGDTKRKAQAYNSKLKQVFSAAFRILLTKTDAPQYYLDFNLSNASGKKRDFFIVPTKSTIGKDKIRITHNGRNPDFTR